MIVTIYHLVAQFGSPSLYIALVVICWPLWIVECALCCFQTPADVRARKTLRRKAAAGRAAETA